MIDINELRRLVQAATPGPWVATTVVTSVGVCHKVGPFPGRTTEHPPRHACLYVDYESAGNAADREIYANARLIAAANPAAISELLDRLEAAEQTAQDYLRIDREKAQIAQRLEAAEKERDALRAKIEAMEQQEPVGWLFDGDFYEVRQMSLYKDNKPLQGQTALYALPGAQAQPAPSVPVLTPAARDILGERRRQIEVEGWTPLHDDAHAPGDLSSAAMGYAQSAACKLSHEGLALEGVPLFWPWEASWFKPSTARQDLIKAGALILAEIERLDRAAAPGTASRPIVPSVPDESVHKAWGRFSNELHRSPDAPYPGMSEAFEAHFSQSFTDREWRMEASVWAAAWKAAKNHGAQAPIVPDCGEAGHEEGRCGNKRCHPIVQAQPAPNVPDDVIEQAVNRFLSWKLPKDFHPDGGMVFIPTKGRGYDSPHWPIGTNLFTAEQAREMLRYALAAAPESKP